MSELNDKDYRKIKALCAQGDRHADLNDYQLALELYWNAWDLLPPPQTEWDAATWILTAIGDSNYLSGDFESGRDNLANAMHCPKAIGNPFLHLRLGQCHFELDTFDRAVDELTRAMMGGGEVIFQEEDPKYWSFLKTKIRPPVGGWSMDESKKRPWWKIW